MPTVDEMGRSALQEQASLHSQIERAQVMARVAARRAAEARAHYDMLSADSIAAARAARRAVGAPDFAALLARHKALHGATQIAFRTYSRARIKADRLLRAAHRLERAA